MTTLHLKGRRLNCWFAEQLVNDYGAVEALNKTCGPARKAVEQVIANRGLEVDHSKVEPDRP